MRSAATSAPTTVPASPPPAATWTSARRRRTRPIPRAVDQEPKDSGQDGVKLDYTFESLNSLDVALYAIQYHSRLPLFSEISVPIFGAPTETARYFAEFPENIKLYGRASCR